MQSREDGKGVEDVDAILAVWRQGDCCLQNAWFAYVAAAANQVSSGSTDPASEEGMLVDLDEVRGLAVVSQTCDIVRSSIDRPYVQVSPLVDVSDVWLREIQQWKRPNYAFVPAVADQRLVADLDRVMTVEKRVVALWPRTVGCRSDKEQHDFGHSIARKLTRFAFPDDFTELVAKLRDALIKKHDKQSPQGEALRGLREIRVLASPGWDAKQIDVFLWFVLLDGACVPEGLRWDELLKTWLELTTPAGRYVSVEGQISTLEDLTARDYLDSDALDLEHLSLRQPDRPTTT